MKELDQMKMLSESMMRIEADEVDDVFGADVDRSKVTNRSMQNTSFPMTWERYVSSDGEWADWEWNIDADGAPDGVHNVAFPYIDNVGVAKGVTVKDGKFVLEPTIAAITKARDDVKYWGSYIERIEWNAEHKAFIVTIGS